MRRAANGIAASVVAPTVMVLCLLFCVATAQGQRLAPTNGEVPFCYRPGDTVAWPILVSPQLENGEQLLAKFEGGELKQLPIAQAGVRIGFEKDRLIVTAEAQSHGSLKLSLKVQRGGEAVQSQTLTLQPAPPDRPVSYISDMLDDLIRIFRDPSNNTFRPVEKYRFDAYFRRLQAQGIRRLIVWQSPFPITTDPNNFARQDWERFRAQATAILESPELAAGMQQDRKLKAYQYIGMMMAMRLDPNAGRAYAQSAHDHGIRLTASFRPFEMALMKYYQIPTFDEDGTYLWQFLPHGSPTVNCRAPELGFANHKEILRQMGREPAATVRSLEINSLQGAARLLARHRQGKRDIGVFAAGAPPLDETSFVLIRDKDGGFTLKKYAQIKEAVQSTWRPLDYQLRKGDSGKLIIDIPLRGQSQYLIITALTEEGAWLRWPVVAPLSVSAADGNQLNRLNYWISQKGDKPDERATRVAGIPADGMYHTEFQAVEESVDYFRHHLGIQWSLENANLVVNLGEPWSTEMVDFQRPAARKFAVQQLKSILAHDAFDEIMLNTRSHTQLAGSSAEGGDGPRPLAHYRLIGRNYSQLSIDRAYAPISLTNSPAIRKLASNPKTIEQLTTWQNTEWQNACQSADSTFVWRYERNRAIADGIRQLLVDLEREFPDARIRAVIPHSAAVTQSMREQLNSLPRPNSKPYGAVYFRHIWGTNNHMPTIGEGMTMVDLRGLRTEPTYLGIRHLPERDPLDLFLTECEKDLRDSRGSQFRGSKSIVYEGQESLRHPDKPMATKRRQEIMKQLLSRKDINEVVLYESADWLYALPLDGTAHAYLGE